MWWRPWSPLGTCDAAPLLRGRRGTWRYLPSFCVAGVALGDMDLNFVWQAWHLRHWAGSGGGLGRRWGPVTPRLFCVAGVALGDICLRFVWQAWHLVTSAFVFVWQAWRLVTSAFVLCGRRGTYGTGLALVAALVGVALGDICLRFVWQAWHLRHWAGSGGGLGRRWGAVTPRSFWVAGVALDDICLRFAWQAWHLGAEASKGPQEAFVKAPGAPPSQGAEASKGPQAS
eukprot:s3350_g6.t1